MHTAAADLLHRAQHAGTLTPDLDVVDLLAAANGIARVAADDAQADRLLAILRAGVGRADR